MLGALIWMRVYKSYIKACDIVKVFGLCTHALHVRVPILAQVSLNFSPPALPAKEIS